MPVSVFEPKWFFTIAEAVDTGRRAMGGKVKEHISAGSIPAPSTINISNYIQWKLAG